MLRPRIIPCLLIKDSGLVKTVKFGNPKYVGDPINAVRIFNEKEVDELIVLDIDATVKQQEPDYRLISQLAAECRMPLCYGGGVKTVEQVKKILSLGVEKIALSSAIVGNHELISEIVEQVGSQSIVVVLDVKKRLFGSQYDVYTHNGTKKTTINIMDFVQQLEKLGVGEVVINSIDHDGVMNGYDLDLIAKIKSLIHVPMTVLGGAGSLTDIGSLIKQYEIIGSAAGSLFVFKGVYRAVLINYPSHQEKLSLIAN